jgi:hypothetical protein
MGKYETYQREGLRPIMRLYTAKKKTARVKSNLDLRYGPKRTGKSMCWLCEILWGWNIYIQCECDEKTLRTINKKQGYSMQLEYTTLH